MKTSEQILSEILTRLTHIEEMLDASRRMCGIPMIVPIRSDEPYKITWGTGTSTEQSQGVPQ